MPDGSLEAVDDRPDLLRIVGVAVIMMVISFFAMDMRILMAVGMIVNSVVGVELS